MALSPLARKSSPHMLLALQEKPGMVVYACKLGTQEAEGGELKFQVNLIFKTLCLKSMDSFYIVICVGFACMYVCVFHACPVPVEVKRCCQVNWNWNYKHLWGAS